MTRLVTLGQIHASISGIWHLTRATYCHYSVAWETCLLSKNNFATVFSRCCEVHCLKLIGSLGPQQLSQHIYKVILENQGQKPTWPRAFHEELTASYLDHYSNFSLRKYSQWVFSTNRALLYIPRQHKGLRFTGPRWEPETPRHCDRYFSVSTARCHQCVLSVWLILASEPRSTLCVLVFLF